MRRLLLILLLSVPALSHHPRERLPEEPVCTPDIQPIAGGYAVAMEPGDSTYLVVSIYITHFNAVSHEAMLLDEHGEPLLEKSIHLPDNASQSAAVSWNGREYLIVYGDFYGGVHALRIDRD